MRASSSLESRPRSSFVASGNHLFVCSAVAMYLGGTLPAPIPTDFATHKYIPGWHAKLQGLSEFALRRLRDSSISCVYPR